LWFFQIYHIQLTFLPFYCERYPLIAVLFTGLGGKYLLAVTSGRALADPEFIGTSECPNHQS